MELADYINFKNYELTSIIKKQNKKATQPILVDPYSISLHRNCESQLSNQTIACKAILVNRTITAFNVDGGAFPEASENSSRNLRLPCNG